MVIRGIKNTSSQIPDPKITKIGTHGGTWHGPKQAMTALRAHGRPAGIRFYGLF
jgi:hypothetical protein